MAANTCFAWSAVGVALLATGARALPQPAYAVGATGSGSAADTLDRYGGRAPGSSPSAAASDDAVSGRPARFLSWSGKPESALAATQAVVPSPQTAATPTVWRPPAARAGAPATIYDPPPRAALASSARALQPVQPPAPSPRRQTEGGPRFYSVHRDYGIQPDAIPLAPQFFGPTADLSAPPSDPLVKRVTSASGQTRTVEVASGDQTSP